jgi:N-dimethylarginine dimethylaminohydrolase
VANSPPVSEIRPVERVATKRLYLMCRPDHFTVTCSINPFMNPARPTDTALAVAQWESVRDTYLDSATTWST